MKKVFCGKCKWFWPLLNNCHHESNTKDNWRTENCIFKKHPSVINAKNDCKKFEEKE